MKLKAQVTRQKLVIQTLKVLLDFFQKIVGSRGNALGASRRTRNTFASISAGWGEKTVQWTVFEGKPTRLEGFPLMVTSYMPLGASFCTFCYLFLIIFWRQSNKCVLFVTDCLLIGKTSKTFTLFSALFFCFRIAIYPPFSIMYVSYKSRGAFFTQNQCVAKKFRPFAPPGRRTGRNTKRRGSTCSSSNLCGRTSKATTESSFSASCCVPSTP